MHEGHGNHWECVVENVEDLLENDLRVMLEHGRLIDPRPDRPLQDGDVVGLSYGDTPLRALSLIAGRRDGDQLGQVFASGYPFAVQGVRHRLVIDEIIPWQEGMEAWIKASFPDGDGPQLGFFDTRYYAHHSRLKVGMEADFVLAGLAYSAEVAHPEPVTITDPAVIQSMRQGTNDPDDTSPIKILLTGGAFLFPREDYAPDEFEFQAPVKAAQPFELRGRRLVRLTVTLVRLLDRVDEDIDIDLYVAEHVWRSNERPMPGADVQGVMWLQGYLAED